MLENRVTPSSIAQWCQRLDAKPLPVLPDNAEALDRALKQPDVALHDLAHLIASDPVMTLHLLRECQRQFGTRVEGSLSNIPHCVAMLGLDKTLILARTFTALPQPLDKHLPYLEALACALHSAELARNWLSKRHPSGADQVYLAALLQGIVDAAMWYFAPKEMRAIQVLTEQESIPEEEADLAVIGCTRSQLAAALASQWHFPPSVCDAITPGEAPSPIFLLQNARRAEKDPRHKLPNRDDGGHLVRSHSLYVRLARWLALYVRQNWYSRTLQRCYSVLAACLFITPQDARHLTQETSLKLSRHWPIPLVAAPACGLLWPPRPTRRRRIKPAQLPKVVQQLLAGKVPANKPDAVKPTPTAASRPPAPIKPPPAPPPKIGLTSRNLPEDLDRNAILNAPKPKVAAAEAPRFSGFKSLQKKQAFEQFLQQLLTDPLHFSTENDVVRAVVEHLHDCTELTRVVVALYNAKLDYLEGYFALGCDQYRGLARYKVKLQPTNLFTHLMKQPAALWLSPDRPNKAAGLMPGAFKQANQTDTCFLMSAFNHLGPYAMSYADRGVDDRLGLSEHEYTIFKSACSACTKHLLLRGKQTGAKRT